MNAKPQLNSLQNSTRRKHEQNIKDNLAVVNKCFLEIGNSLAAIRDDKLYIDTHESFESYVEERFDVSRRRAYQLIDTFEMHGALCTMVHTLPANERQYRELKKIPEKDRVDVWNAVVEDCGNDSKPTAGMIEAKFKAISQEYDQDDDTDEDESVDEDLEQDDESEPLEEEFREEWRENDLIEINKTAASLRRSIKVAQNASGNEELVKNRNSILVDLDNVIAKLSNSTPFETCPYCCGFGDDCPSCGDHGWVDKATFNNAPEENRNAVTRLSSGGRE